MPYQLIPLLVVVTSHKGNLAKAGIQSQTPAAGHWLCPFQEWTLEHVCPALFCSFLHTDGNGSYPCREGGVHRGPRLCMDSAHGQWIPLSHPCDHSVLQGFKLDWVMSDIYTL